jgi:hypothetical protein
MNSSMLTRRDLLKTAAAMAIVSPTASGSSPLEAAGQAPANPRATSALPKTTGLSPAEQLRLEDENNLLSLQWARKHLNL